VAGGGGRVIALVAWTVQVHGVEGACSVVDDIRHHEGRRNAVRDPVGIKAMDDPDVGEWECGMGLGAGGISVRAMWDALSRRVGKQHGLFANRHVRTSP